MQIIILLIAIAVLVYFSTAAQNHIQKAFATAGCLVRGAWDRRPTTGQVLRILAIPIALMFVPWIIFFFIMWWLGTQFNAPQAGMWIGILLPIWSLLFIIRKIHPFRILYRVFATVLLIAILLLLIGFWSPDVKNSLNERSDDSKVWTANFFKKGSTHSERNAGVRARVKSATGVCDDFNKPIEGVIPAGRIVMVLKNIQSKPATENREALLPVMLPDRHGNFFDGKRVWMPALKIEFINNEEQETKYDPAASAVPGEKWKLCWKMPEGYVGNSSMEGICGIAETKKTKETIHMIFNSKSGTATFRGVSSDGKKYTGIWDDQYRKGKFSLDFVSDDSAIGYLTDDEEKNVRIDVMFVKI